MTLEATMVLVDNSEWMRNGDYIPSRYEAQADAVNALYSAKTGANPESMVGVMSTAGKMPAILINLGRDFSRAMNSVLATKIDGEMNFLTSLQIAQLALKHRSNKAQRQRIIAFVGSPIGEDENTLIKVARKMKKNGVAIDIVNFGDIDENGNTKKLESFVENVNSGDNSHILTIPSDSTVMLSDTIGQSPIIGEGYAFARTTTAGADDLMGLEELDPELAMALRLSMEEETARLSQQRRQEEEEERQRQADSAPEPAQPENSMNEQDAVVNSQSESKNPDDDKMEE